MKMLKLVKSKWFWIILAALSPFCCCLSSPFWLTGATELMLPFANGVRIQQAASHEFVTLSDVTIKECPDGCPIQFEHQKPLKVLRDGAYIEYVVANSAPQRLEESFNIVEFKFDDKIPAQCAYYPEPSVNSGQTSSVRCILPKQEVDEICMTLEFPNVLQFTWVGKPIHANICQRIDGGKK